jgi:hypothetical protein
VADGHVSGKFLDALLAENVGDEAHCFLPVEAFAVGGYDPRRLLAAVLQ